ncbi:hypothetical protein NSS98_25310 [Paenibacillus sp. FSL E2-0274]|uniref:hypothetical protein n=1 Tax=Paenibacillus TaxID=44249 RepID=UPI00096EADDA|nr:hypothetical protein [Paenibacillus odorifer]OME29401.1 hypothetical protein BSK63_21875 [Paenibacillus odorifer]
MSPFETTLEDLKKKYNFKSISHEFEIVGHGSKLTLYIELTPEQYQKASSLSNRSVGGATYALSRNNNITIVAGNLDAMKILLAAIVN